MDTPQDKEFPIEGGIVAVNVQEPASEVEVSLDQVESPTTDSHILSGNGRSVDASVLGQVSNDTQYEGSLNDHAKQLQHQPLEQLDVESPQNLPVTELGMLEGQDKGLVLATLEVLKDEKPVTEQAGNQDFGKERFHETLSNLPTDGSHLQSNNTSQSAVAHSQDTNFKDVEETGSNLRPGYSSQRVIAKKAKSLMTTLEPLTFVGNAITVKFHLSDGEVFTKAYIIHTNIEEVRENLAEELHFPFSMIKVYKDNIMLDDWLPLAALGVELFGTLELVLESADPIRYPITRRNSSLTFVRDTRNVGVPDVINVTVEIDDKNYKELVVEIWNEAIEKPWVGGYRDQKSVREFHHAFTQTTPFYKAALPNSRANRDTQTVECEDKVQNTPSEKATQSDIYRINQDINMINDDIYKINHDIYIPTIHDKILMAKKYVSYAQLEEERNLLHKVITIQRYTRGWLVRKMVNRLRENYLAQLAWQEEQATKQEKAVVREVKKHVIRQVYPQSRADFEMLYSMVERWRLAEVKRISELKTEAPKKAELCYLLEKEIVLLNSIEKHRMRLKKEKLEKKEIDFIEKSSKPIVWTGKDGHVISMDTVRTQRARELKHLYTSLCQENLNIEERVNLLISLKHALKTYNTSTRILEIISLMERECDCLVRGLKNADMEYLRKRVKKMFLELMRDPTFNPEVAKYLPDTADVMTNQFKCARCGVIYPQDKFVKTTMTKRLSICTSCSWTENIAGKRIELGPFQHIVRALRRDEQKRCSFSSFAFVMQDEDFYFLINNIWHSHSFVSECDDMFRLRLCRWKVEEEWSPWNCILLTVDEMRAHLNIDHLEDAYESIFIHDVTLKHYLARNHFKHLEKMDVRFRESGKWFKPDQSHLTGILYQQQSSELD